MSMLRRLPLYMYIASMGMEMCPLYLGLIIIMRIFGFGSSFIILVLFCYFISFLLHFTLMGRSDQTRGKRVLYIAGLSAAAAVVVILIMEFLASSDLKFGPGMVLIIAFQIVLCVFPWWIGGGLVRRRINYQYSCGRFQISLICLLALVAIEGKTTIPVFFFFLCAVISLSLARWEDSAAGSMQLLQPMRSRALIGGCLRFIVPGIILLPILSPEISRDIISWFTWLGMGLVRLCELMGIAPTPKQHEMIDILPGCAYEPKTKDRPTPAQDYGTQESDPIAAGIILGFIVVIVIYFMIKNMRKIKLQQRDQVPDVEATYVPVGLFEELIYFFRRIWDMLLLLFGFSRHAISKKEKKEERSIRSLRALYRRLLRWAKRKGVPRETWQTPFEFLEEVRMRYPQKESELCIITDAYIQARYSPHTPGRDVLENALSAWN